MENKQLSNNVKKRIMFNRDDDYYFITYNILIFLHTIGCVDDKSKFQDYTKLIYIIPFISYNYLLDIHIHYKETDRSLIDEELQFLSKTYIKSRMRVKLITSILFALERNNLITLEKNTIRNSIDIWVNQDKFPTSFASSSLYKLEVEQAGRFKKLFPKIKTIKTDTLIDSLFSSKGVTTWLA
jgi:hypothetical protein